MRAGLIKSELVKRSSLTLSSRSELRFRNAFNQPNSIPPILPSIGDPNQAIRGTGGESPVVHKNRNATQSITNLTANETSTGTKPHSSNKRPEGVTLGDGQPTRHRVGFQASHLFCLAQSLASKSPNSVGAPQATKSVADARGRRVSKHLVKSKVPKKLEVEKETRTEPAATAASHPFFVHPSSLPDPFPGPFPDLPRLFHGFLLPCLFQQMGAPFGKTRVCNINPRNTRQVRRRNRKRNWKEMGMDKRNWKNTSLLLTLTSTRFGNATNQLK
jgi:hypothetical protein